MRSLVRFRVPILIGFLALTVLLCSQIGNVRLTADPLASMFPFGHPFLPALKAIKRMAPEPRMLIAILEVENGDIYNEETIRKIDRITKGLMGIEGVLPGGITSLTRGIDQYENTGEGLAMEPILGRRWPATKEEFAGLRRRVAVNPRGPGRYVSYDGTATMITAELFEGDEETLMESLLKGVKKIQSSEKDARYHLYFMGPQLINAQMASMGRRQIPMAAAATFLLIFVSLFGYFRTFRGALLPIAAMAASLLWTFGMLGASGVEFNPMPLVFPLLLGLFSLAYGVLIVEHYDHAYPCTGDPVHALRAAYGRSRVAAALVTAALVLFSLFVAGIPLYRDLAWLGLFWTVGTGAAVGLFLPALISLAGAPGGRKSGQDGSPSPVATALSRARFGKGRCFLLGVPAVTLLVGAFCLRGLEVGDNVPGSSYIPPCHSWNQCLRVMADKFMGPYQLLVYVKAKEKGGLLDPEALLAIGDFRRYLKKQAGAKDCIAFDMMVTAARKMMMDGNPKWLTIPVSREQVRGMGELVVDQGGVEDFIDKTFTEATISPFFPDKKTREIDRYAAMMQAYIDLHPSDMLDFCLGGGLLGMTKAINDGTRNAYWKTLVVAFCLVLVVGVPVTGSLRSALAGFFPIAAAQGVIWMIMAAAGIKINMPVAIVSAGAVGLSSLFGYALAREIREAPGGGGQRDPDADPGVGRARGTVIFLGGLIFAALLPWFFIGLRFPSRMALVFGLTVFLAALWSAFLLPGLDPRSWTAPLAGGVEEEDR